MFVTSQDIELDREHHKTEWALQWSWRDQRKDSRGLGQSTGQDDLLS